MIITFDEKENEKYEVNDDHAKKIFDKTKEELLKIIEKYSNSNKDVVICITAMGCIVKEFMQTLSDKHGADELIELMGAKEVKP